VPIEKEEAEVITKVAYKLAELGLEAIFKPPITKGPIISAYRFTPKGRTRVSHLEMLASDFAIALGVEDVLVKRMPGESAVGIFVPRKEREEIKFLDTVSKAYVYYNQKDLKSLFESVPIPLNFGVDSLGRPAIEDLEKMPHLLIAGSTGSGKSTLLTSILATLVYVLNSNTLKLVLSDTKGVEFGHFIGAPHLLFEPATSIYQTLERMDWIIDEMESRLKIIAASGNRNIHEYNSSLTIDKLKIKGIVDDGETDGIILPYIVLVIDELADLMLHRGKERGESKIAQDKLSMIVQKSRAAGVYVIAATQRPSVNVVAGSIKANFPARLTFRLPSSADSRTVIGTGGAEHLLSRGDMLFLSPNKPGLHRFHAPFVATEEIAAAVDLSVRRGY